jgi:hypothetical protein
MDSERKSKTIMPPKKESNLNVIVTHGVDRLIDDAIGVIAIEISRYSSRVQKGITLTLPESRIVQGYIKALCELSKERREQESHQDLANMDDAALLALVQKIMDKAKK